MRWRRQISPQSPRIVIFHNPAGQLSPAYSIIVHRDQIPALLAFPGKGFAAKIGVSQSLILPPFTFLAKGEPRTVQSFSGMEGESQGVGRLKPVLFPRPKMKPRPQYLQSFQRRTVRRQQIELIAKICKDPLRRFPQIFLRKLQKFSVIFRRNALLLLAWENTVFWLSFFFPAQRQNAPLPSDGGGHRRIVRPI